MAQSQYNFGICNLRATLCNCKHNLNDCSSTFKQTNMNCNIPFFPSLKANKSLTAYKPNCMYGFRKHIELAQNINCTELPESMKEIRHASQMPGNYRPQQK